MTPCPGPPFWLHQVLEVVLQVTVPGSRWAVWHDAQVTVRKATGPKCATGVLAERLDWELRCSKTFHCTVHGWHGPPVLNMQLATAKAYGRPQLENNLPLRGSAASTGHRPRGYRMLLALNGAKPTNGCLSSHQRSATGHEDPGTRCGALCRLMVADPSCQANW